MFAISDTALIFIIYLMLDAKEKLNKEVSNILLLDLNTNNNKKMILIVDISWKIN